MFREICTFVTRYKFFKDMDWARFKFIKDIYKSLKRTTGVTRSLIGVTFIH